MSFAESNGVHPPPMHLGSSDGGTAPAPAPAPYYPIMQPLSSSSPPHPTETYHQVPSAAAVAAAAVPLSVAVDPTVSMDPTSIEPVKRKRGRPRKHAPDGSGNSGIISPPPLSTAQSGGGFSPTEGVDGASFVKKRGRGRPPGSSNKQKFADLGSAVAGNGFRSNVITVKAGEDVLAKLTSFSQSTAQAICILSANGSISNVTLQQTAVSVGNVTYEGQFEILCLSGSFLISESGGRCSRTGRLSVLLAGPDGHVFGGGVAGVLTAASAVQIIVGSFGMQGQKQVKLVHSDAFGVPSALHSAASAAKSPSSLGTVSESSGEPVSPHNQLAETLNNGTPAVANNMSWR